MRMAWEMYRHKDGVSEGVTLDADGVRCFTGTLSPTSSSAPTKTPVACSDITINVNTDNYPAETSWTLRNTCTDTVEKSVAPGFYGSTRTANSDTYCVPLAAYDFTLADSYGDGICCQYGSGSYEVIWGGSTVASSGSFGSSSETTSFGSCGPAPTKSPSTSPTHGPTASPIPPTNPPTQSPSTSPTHGPTASPILPTNPPTNAPSTSPTRGPTCGSITRRRDCRGLAECRWRKGICVAR